MNNEQFPELTQLFETDIISGIIDESIVSVLYIAPNPVTAVMSIHYNLFESGEVTFSIFDNSGKLYTSIAKFSDSGEQSILLNINDLPSGVYFCRMSINNKYVAVTNFIVSR